MKKQEMPINPLSKLTKLPVITRNFFVTSGLILLYSVFFTTITSAFRIKDSVNPRFVTDLTNVFQGTVSVFGVALIIIGLRSPKLMFKQVVRTLAPVKYVLIALIPLSPVIRYLIANREITPISDIVIVLLTFIGLALALTAVLPYLLSRYASGRLLLSAANAFCFTILNMASISQTFNWLKEGSTIIQFGLFGLAFVITWILLGLKRGDLSLVIVAFIVGGAIIQVGTESEGLGETQTTEIATEDGLLTTIGGRKPASTPNIYFLVYDSYVPNEILLNYDIDNSAQENYLIEQGFKPYPKTYSVGGYTLASMNAVLNVSPNLTGHSRIGIDGNGVIPKLFRSLGYQTMGIFGTDYFFWGLEDEPGYDYYTPQSEVFPAYQLLLTAIMMGEFRFDIGLEGIPYLEFVSLKRQVFINSHEDPIFVYSHSMIPGHSQLSGVCFPDEIDRYKEKLQTANEEMNGDISTILAHDPDAVIIIAGDHGPYFSKDCTSLNSYHSSEINRTDMQDHYGSFLAVRWPSSDYVEFDQIRVLQDIFPAILSWMYRDESILDSRIPPVTITDNRTGGVGISNGIVIGGADDGEPLFLDD